MKQYYCHMNSWIKNLSPELFWDVSQKEVDPEIHERWLIERVLQRGRWEDWLILKTQYDKSRLRDLIPQLRLDPKAANFLNLYCRT